MEQIEDEQNPAEPERDHCNCTEKLSSSASTVLTTLHQNKTNQRENLQTENILIQINIFIFNAKNKEMDKTRNIWKWNGKKEKITKQMHFSVPGTVCK